MKSFIKKALLTALSLTLCVSVALGVAVVPSAQATAVVESNVFTEDFSGYTPFYQDVSSGKTSFGSWGVYFDSTEAGRISVLSESEASAYGAEGQVLRMDTSPKSGSTGTDHKVVYEAENFKVKNFIATFDFYQISGSGISSSWLALFARRNEQGLNSDRQLFLHVQKGKGTRSDSVPTSDGGTREADTNDIYFQYQSSANTGAGLTEMSEETGIERDMGRYFMTDGGDVVDTWFSLKFIVRDNFASCYMKLKSEDQSGWRFLGRTCYPESRDMNAGYFGFGTCGGDYLIDNLSIISEDGNNVTTAVDAPSDYGEYYGGQYVSKITQSTAAANSDIDLYLSLKDGYIYGEENSGVWYKDNTYSTEITPKSIKLQELTFNDSYAKYEWTDMDITLSAISDLNNEVEGVEDIVSIREYYAGANYRLVVTVNTAENGFNYYAKVSKRKYHHTVTVSGDGTITGAPLVLTENVLRGKLEIGTAIAFKATANSGAKFAGWYKLIESSDGETYRLRLDNNENYNYTSELGGIKIEAVFVPIDAVAVNVEFNTKLIDGNSTAFGSVLTVSGTYFAGETISLMAKEETGFAFWSWKNGNNEISTALNVNIELSESMNITAEFEVEKYRVFIYDGISGETIERTVTANSEVTLAAPAPPVGKTFSRWVVEGVGTDYVQNAEDRTVVFNATNRRIYATAYFVNSTHKVVVGVSDTSQGTVLGSGSKQYGDTVTITVKPKPGYAIARYTVRGVDITLGENGTFTFVMPDNDVNIRIEFSTIDNVEPNKEITAYIIFGVFIVLVAAALLFVNNGDGSGDSPTGAGKAKIKELREAFEAQKALEAQAAAEQSVTEDVGGDGSIEETADEEEQAEEFADDEDFEDESSSSIETEQADGTEDKFSGFSKSHVPFSEKLTRLSEEVLGYYNLIKEKFGEYKRVSIRESLKGISIRNGRKLIAKLTIVGKTLRLHLALDVDAFNFNAYFQRDLSSKKAFKETPFTVRVKSARGYKNAIKLIDALAVNNNLIKKALS